MPRPYTYGVDMTTRRGRPKGATLTTERVVAEAVAAVEEDGLEVLSMRALARRLGVDPMSLYNHVENRDALLDAIAAFVLTRIELPAHTGDLRTDVEAVAFAFREVAIRHPRCAPLVLSRQIDALVPTEHALAVLRRAGFDEEEAVHALRAALAYVVGCLQREIAFQPHEQRQALLEASNLPHVVASARHLARCAHLDEFRYGLDLLITAFEARPRG